jgi:ubiquinone biosynthesis protein UbiJ
MGFAGLIVNRTHDLGLGGHSAEQVAGLLSEELGEALAGRVAGNLADFDVLARRDRESVRALSEALGEDDPVLVPHLDGDVQDLRGLAIVAEHLFS